VVEVRLYRGRGFISKLIQWQTRSPYSHASVAFGDREGKLWIIDAREGKGCRLRIPLAEDDRADRFRVRVTEQQQQVITSFLQSQVGKPYDYTMVARFLTRRQVTRRSSGKWFCSELVFAAFRHAGVPLLERVEPWAVSPGMLAHSPLLEGAS
jgi:uncharacterized protein YycO